MNKYNFEIKSFAETETRTIQWLWPDMIPFGMLTLLGGKGGLGKSFALCDLVARASTGKPMPDGTCNPPMDVLMLAREDDPNSVMKARLLAAGADMERVHWTKLESLGETPSSLDFVTCCKNGLVDFSKERNVGLITIDTFASFATEKYGHQQCTAGAPRSGCRSESSQQDQCRRNRYGTLKEAVQV